MTLITGLSVECGKWIFIPVYTLLQMSLVPARSLGIFLSVLSSGKWSTCSVGFRSGDWLGRCITFDFFALKNSFSWSNWLKMSSSSECLKKNVRIHPAALISSRIMKKCKASHAHYMEQLNRQMFFHIVSNPLRRCLETKRWELCASCNIHGPDWNDCGCPPFRIKSWVCLKTNKKIKRDSQCLHCEVGCVVIFFPDLLGKPSGLTIISGVHTYQKSGRDTWLFEDILFWLACAALVIWISTTRLQEK